MQHLGTLRQKGPFSQKRGFRLGKDTPKFGIRDFTYDYFVMKASSFFDNSLG